jgi:hypothetical protein
MPARPAAAAPRAESALPDDIRRVFEGVDLTALAIVEALANRLVLKRDQLAQKAGIGNPDRLRGLVNKQVIGPLRRAGIAPPFTIEGDGTDESYRWTGPRKE